MRLLLLNMMWNLPNKPWPVPNPVPVANFAAAAVGLNPAIVPSAIPGACFSEVRVSPASLLWDAVVCGYGTLANLALLAATPAERARVRSIAAWRAQLLRLAYEYPRGDVWGPIQRDERKLIETTELGVVSFFLGQTIAQRAAREIWPVRRVYHRRLYAHVAMKIAGVPIPPRASPDYFAPVFIGNVPVALTVVEAKGRSDRFRPDSNSKHLWDLGDAFRQLEDIGLTPHHYGVSLATHDAWIEKLSPGCVVGHFWDPPVENAWRLPEAVFQQLEIEYISRLRAVLVCLGPPQRRVRRGTTMAVWSGDDLGLTIAMEHEIWRALVAQDSRDLLPRLEPRAEMELHQDDFEVVTQDGLYLKMGFD